LATALLQECSYLMTYEPKLLKLVGQHETIVAQAFCVAVPGEDGAIGRCLMTLLQ
jgi:hypothetical protein